MSEPYDRVRWERAKAGRSATEAESNARAERSRGGSRERLRGLALAEDVAAFASGARRAERPAETVGEPSARRLDTAGARARARAPTGSPSREPERGPRPRRRAGGRARVEPGLEPEPAAPLSDVPDDEPEALALDDGPVSHEHAPGELEVPPGYAVLEGEPDGERRAVGIVVAASTARSRRGCSSRRSPSSRRAASHGARSR